MICPYCKKETSSVYRHCENCKQDLEQYKEERKKAIEGTGEIYLGTGSTLESLLVNAGPIGGLILIILSIAWFIGGLTINKIYFYPPILFFIGIYGFFAGMNRAKKRRELAGKKKRGEILD